MTDAQHARILSAYLNRLTGADLEDIMAKQWEAHDASLNGSIGFQMKMQNEANKAVERAVSHLIAHDKSLIKGVIEQVMAVVP